MERQWLVKTDGDPVGPVSTDLVRKGREAGKIPANALVREVGTSEWIPVSAITDAPSDSQEAVGSEAVAEPAKEIGPKLKQKKPKSDAEPKERKWKLSPWIAVPLGALVGFLVGYYVVMTSGERVWVSTFWDAWKTRLFEGGRLIHADDVPTRAMWKLFPCTIAGIGLAILAALPTDKPRDSEPRT